MTIFVPLWLRSLLGSVLVERERSSLDHVVDFLLHPPLHLGELGKVEDGPANCVGGGFYSSRKKVGCENVQILYCKWNRAEKKLFSLGL